MASPKERASQRKMIIEQKTAKLSSMDVAEIYSPPIDCARTM